MGPADAAHAAWEASWVDGPTPPAGYDDEPEDYRRAIRRDERWAERMTARGCLRALWPVTAEPAGDDGIPF